MSTIDTMKSNEIKIIEIKLYIIIYNKFIIINIINKKIMLLKFWV
jgi:hypothetical protein